MDLRQFATEFLKEFGPIPFGSAVPVATAAIEGEKDAVIMLLVDLLRKSLEHQKKAEIEAATNLFFAKARLDDVTREKEELNDIVVNGLQAIRANQ